ncbi:hypothetical protein JXJ21_23350 [candidate division KSB1 bacterium]|nr:hypothetical protein [candidate division KSB1 bacterium]
MLQRVYRRFWNYLYHKVMEKNESIIPNGFVEINPRLINDCLVYTCSLEHRVNRLDELAKHLRIKEALYSNTLAQYNQVVGEVFPLLVTSLSLIKKNLETNCKLRREIKLLKGIQSSQASDDHKIRHRILSSSIKNGAHLQKIEETCETLADECHHNQEAIMAWLAKHESHPSLRQGKACHGAV